MRSYCIFYSDEISIVTIKYLMLIEIDSLDLIAEFCIYIYIAVEKFPSAFMSYDQVSSPLL